MEGVRVKAKIKAAGGSLSFPKEKCTKPFGSGEGGKWHSLAGRGVCHNLGASASGGGTEWGGEIAANCGTGKAGLWNGYDSLDRFELDYAVPSEFGGHERCVAGKAGKVAATIAAVLEVSVEPVH